jgi:hypothetical protein
MAPRGRAPPPPQSLSEAGRGGRRRQQGRARRWLCLNPRAGCSWGPNSAPTEVAAAAASMDMDSECPGQAPDSRVQTVQITNGPTAAHWHNTAARTVRCQIACEYRILGLMAHQEFKIPSAHCYGAKLKANKHSTAYCLQRSNHIINKCIYTQQFDTFSSSFSPLPAHEIGLNHFHPNI